VIKKGDAVGRTRSYDEDAVLAGAMHAFRRKGFQAVSIRDLEEATGLKLGSIYNSFGDKAGLFEAAFAHYNRTVLQTRIARYAAAEAGLGGLRELFLSLLREPNHESFGCLITNIAVELGGAASGHRCVKEGLSTLHSTFAERLEAARAAGALHPRIAPKRAAVKLLALYQGVLVLLRGGYDKAALKRLIIDEFADLEDNHDA
jgi:TetR/AcrR family transcriptional regulator, transcriptional repressor for nem operon